MSGACSSVWSRMPARIWRKQRVAGIRLQEIDDVPVTRGCCATCMTETPSWCCVSQLLCVLGCRSPQLCPQFRVSVAPPDGDPVMPRHLRMAVRRCRSIPEIRRHLQVGSWETVATTTKCNPIRGFMFTPPARIRRSGCFSYSWSLRWNICCPRTVVDHLSAMLNGS